MLYLALHDLQFRTNQASATHGLFIKDLLRKNLTPGIAYEREIALNLPKPFQGQHSSYPALRCLECWQRINRVLDPEYLLSQMIKYQSGCLAQSVAHSDGNTLSMILKLFPPSG